MFVTMGIVGVLGALVWFRLYRTPSTAELALDDHAYLEHNRSSASPVTAAQWARLFRFRTVWALILMAFCTGYAVWMYQTWLPAYLEMQQHVSIARTGFLAAIPLFCSILGSWSGGYISDWLAAHGMNLVASRKYPSVVGLLASGLFTALAMTAHSGGEAVVLMSFAMFFLNVGITAKWTLITAVAPQSYCTSTASIQNFGGYIGGTVSPLPTGVVVDMTGSFVIAQAIGAIITVTGACILMFMLKSPIEASDLDAEPVPAG
jgi:nitrate/nitrite transporter NarK